MGDVQRFRNVTEGVIGAVAINEEGKREGIAVAPGETVELNDLEQKLTARAPRSPADNPLVAGGPDGGAALVPVEASDDRPVRPEPQPDPPAEQPLETGQLIAVLDNDTETFADAGNITVPSALEALRERAAAGDAQAAAALAERRLDGPAAVPAGDAPEGSFAPGEQVGTPDAPAAA